MPGNDRRAMRYNSNFGKVGSFNTNSEAVLLGEGGNIHILCLPEYCQRSQTDVKYRSPGRGASQAGIWGSLAPASFSGREEGQRSKALGGLKKLELRSHAPDAPPWSDPEPFLLLLKELLHPRVGAGAAPALLSPPHPPTGSYKIHYLMNFPHIPWR